MQTKKVRDIFCDNQTSHMFGTLKRKLRHICSRVRLLIWKRRRHKVIIKRFGKSNPKSKPKTEPTSSKRPIRIATFNVAMFSLAPAIPDEESCLNGYEEEDYKAQRSPLNVNTDAKSMNYHPKSILKQSPLHTSMNNTLNLSHSRKLSKPKLKVTINLPDNEISLAHSSLLGFGEVPARSPVCFPVILANCRSDESFKSNRSIFEVLREVDADILALQDVKAEEEKGMKPLSDLAAALGMKYVFAESWAPEYGNALLSKWPIKRWRVQKIADDDDFRNVLRATVDVPGTGEVNFHCTQLDHLDETWRMKQIKAIIQSKESPHILLGGLNSLNESDYSWERWMDITKYYEDIGKPTPKVEVMKFLKGKAYTDAKDFAGECEPVVIIAKGQNVQGTCKYGTRVDYILASPDSPYKFVPGSYSVVSSKGTSDHHIVKADIIKVGNDALENANRQQKAKQKVVRITSSFSKGIWKINT